MIILRHLGWRQLLYRSLVVSALLLASGCGSLIEGQAGMGREIVITSSPPGALVTLNGVPKGTTPARLTFNAREIASSTITASKEGYHFVTIDSKRGVNSSLIGNVIIGGIGGVLVDGISGAAIRNAKAIHVELQPLSVRKKP